MAPYVAMIHAIDSYKLLVEVNKQASKVHRVIPLFIADTYRPRGNAEFWFLF